MPEGDTIHRTAAALRSALLGKPMTAFEAPRLTGVRPGVGSVVERVESWGKHLEIGFDDGIVLHTHMRMTGSWHLYHPGQRWRKSARAARVVIEVPGWQAVCFSAPVVDTYRTKELSRHPLAGSLGPDLCRADADVAECVHRMGSYVEPTALVEDVLLDQRIACGVGNVYKSEVLWAVELHPLTPIGAVDQRGRWALLETAARLLRANLDRPGRITHGVGLAVYGRTGKPCARCATPIEVARHGVQARVTYWCPGCQQLLVDPGAPTPPDPEGRDAEADLDPVVAVLDDYLRGGDGTGDEEARPYEIPRPWREPPSDRWVPRARLWVLDGPDVYGDEADGWYDDDDELGLAAAADDEVFVPVLPPDLRDEVEVAERPYNLRDDPYAVDPWADPWAIDDADPEPEVDPSLEAAPDTKPRRRVRAARPGSIDPLL